MFSYYPTTPSGPGPPHFRGLTITLRHTTLGRDLYLTTHNTHKRQTSMHQAGCEPAIPANQRPKTHALDRSTTGITTNNSTRRVSLADPSGRAV